MTPYLFLRLLALGTACSLTGCAALWSNSSSSSQRTGAYGQSLDNPPRSNPYLADPNAAPTETIERPPGTETPVTDPAAIVSTEPALTAPPSEAPPPVTPPAPPAPTSSQPSYGTPVPGKRGFVYPPGVESKTENMVDVRDFTPGQKVRDPRTGKIFLVP
jgi:hypothetical protein